MNDRAVKLVFLGTFFIVLGILGAQAVSQLLIHRFLSFVIPAQAGIHFGNILYFL